MNIHSTKLKILFENHCLNMLFELKFYSYLTSNLLSIFLGISVFHNVKQNYIFFIPPSLKPKDLKVFVSLEEFYELVRI